MEPDNDVQQRFVELYEIRLKEAEREHGTVLELEAKLTLVKTAALRAENMRKGYPPGTDVYYQETCRRGCCIESQVEGVVIDWDVKDGHITYIVATDEGPQRLSGVRRKGEYRYW